MSVHSLNRSGASHAPRPTHQPATLTLTCVATLIALMNYTAPMTMLPAMTRDLHAGVAGQTWILNGISLGLAAFLLTAGSVADNHGRRRIFTLGAVALAVASVACTLAPTTFVFVAGRLVQGAASAALIAAGLGLLAQAFPAAQARARATALWGSMLGAGIALGPIVSALFAEAWGWRAFYVAAAGAATALGAVAHASLQESRALQARSVDVPGMISLTAGVGLLVATLTVGRDGWQRPAVWLLAVSAVLMLALFVTVETRSSEPVLDLALFRRAGFGGATVSALISGISVVALMSYLPTALQRAFGLTALHTAGIFSIWAGTSFVVALRAHRLMRNVPPHLQFGFGLLLAGLGELAMLGTFGSGWWLRLIPGLLITGVSSGILNAALARRAVETVPPDRSSMGSGANNTARYIGSSLGVALIVALVSSVDISTTASLSHGVDLALVVSAAFAALGGAAALALRDRRPSSVTAERSREC